MQFYVLNKRPRGADDTRASLPSDHNQGPADKCAKCGKFISMLKWLPPYRATIELHGNEIGDLVFRGVGSDLLVSELFAELWKHHQLQGLSGFQPVEVIKIKSRRKNPARPPRYLRVNVSYGPAALDLKASGMEWLETPACMECRASSIIRWQRVAIEEDTWTGEDIFAPRGLSGTWTVTPRFKALCEDYQIKNAKFIPAEEHGHDFYPGLKDPSELDRFRTPKPESE